MSSSALVATSSLATPPIEDDAELPIDLSQLPSIPAPKSLLLINNFVANTTRFLNHFAHECEERITRVSNNVTKVEILLAILEAKLNSIPDLSVSDVVMDNDTAHTNSDVNQMDLGISDQDLPSMEMHDMPLPPPPPSANDQETAIESMPLPPPPPIELMPPPPPSSMGDFENDEDHFDVDHESPLLKLKDDPVYAKYFAMRRLGIPDQVIEHKLMMDGMDTNILSMDPEGPSPSGGLAPTMTSQPTGPILPIMAPPPPNSVEEFSDDDDQELPPPPPSLSMPRNADQASSGNIGMPFPLPPPPISPTSSIGGASVLFSDPPPPSMAPPISEMEGSSDDDIEEFDADEPPVTAGVMKIKDDPAFEKYFKMRKLGMPDSVIQHKLTMDGVTLDILNMDPEAPSPNATSEISETLASSIDLPPLPPGLPPPARQAGGLPPPPIKRYDDSDSDFDSD
ncbi:putative WASH complex subunit 3 protein [Plasmopara halstedii]